MTDGTIKSAYHRMAVDRQWYLTEAMESAKLTIPSIMPSDQDITLIEMRNSPVDIPKPWQSLGARGTRNLAAKLVLAIFPPTGAFMRYMLSPEFKRELEAPERQEQRAEIEKGFAMRERAIADDIETANVRTKTDQVMRHLLVAGNMMAYLPPGGGVRTFPLNSYVCRRDFMGDVVELIYVEPLDRANLPEAIRETLLKHGAEEDPQAPGELKICDTEKDKTVMVYTRVRLRDARYYFTQEVDGHEVESKRGSVPKAKMPYLVLRLTIIDGEDYGRGYVEEFRGDLRSLEELRKSIVIASLNAARLIPLVRPGAAVTPKKLMEAQNGQAIFGQDGDVVMLQQQKQGDMQVAAATSSDLVTALSAAFLLNSSFQRQAERVTAEEVRRMAEELDDALGGFYSVMSQEYQLPLALRTEERLIKKGVLNRLEPKDAARPVVVTGLAAIGRGHEFNRTRELYNYLATEVMPLIPDVGMNLNGRDAILRGAIGLGVETEGMLKSEEQLAEEQRQQQAAIQRQTLLEAGAPEISKVAAQEIGGQVGQQVAQSAPQ